MARTRSKKNRAPTPPAERVVDRDSSDDVIAVAAPAAAGKADEVLPNAEKGKTATELTEPTLAPPAEPYTSFLHNIRVKWNEAKTAIHSGDTLAFENTLAEVDAMLNPKGVKARAADTDKLDEGEAHGSASASASNGAMDIEMVSPKDARVASPKTIEANSPKDFEVTSPKESEPELPALDGAIARESTEVVRFSPLSSPPPSPVLSPEPEVAKEIDTSLAVGGANTSTLSNNPETINKKRSHIMMNDAATDNGSIQTAESKTEKPKKLNKKMKRDEASAIEPGTAGKASTSGTFKNRLGTVKSSLDLKIKASTDALKKAKDAVLDPASKRRSTRISSSSIAIKPAEEIKAEEMQLVESTNSNCGTCQVNIRPILNKDCVFITLPKSVQALSTQEIEVAILNGLSKQSLAVIGIYSNDTATKTIQFGFCSDATAAVGRTIKFSKQGVKLTACPPYSALFNKTAYLLARTGHLNPVEIGQSIAAAFPNEVHFQIFQRTVDGGQVFTSDYTIVFWHSKLSEKTLEFGGPDGRIFELALRAPKDRECKVCKEDKEHDTSAITCACYRLVHEVPARVVATASEEDDDDDRMDSSDIEAADNDGNHAVYDEVGGVSLVVTNPDIDVEKA